MVSLSRPSMTVRPDRPPRTACSGRRKTRCLFGEIIALTVMLVLCGPSIYGTAEAQEHLQPPIEIKRLDGTIEFDGMPFEEAWEAVEPFPMTQQLPNYGAEPTEHTEVRITYDDEYIYLGGRLYDSDPEGIHPATYQRDRRGLAGDWMIMTLDPHNDKENSLLFGTSPAGNRTDVWFANDTEGDRPVNADWNAFWDAQVGRNDEGWFAEVRVPFSTLRFEPDEEGRVVMGMILFRWIARKQEVHLFPAIPPNWQWANYKASQAQEVVFRDIEPERQVYVTPYVLGGTERRMELLSDGGAYVHSNHPSYEMGVDAKVGVAGHLTLDLTLNTDFAQAEVDDQQVNLSRFSLFFPEKRQFFQEQRGAFDFSTGQVDRVFHSRRIGLQSGEPVRIYGGARLVGRSGPWELGLLNMQTAATDVRSSENMGAYRVRRRVLNRYSHLGAIVTNRITEEGDINAVFGADGQFRFTDADYAILSWAQSYEAQGGVDDSGTIGWHTALARLRWERRGFDGFGWDVSATRVGEAYNPGLGFIQRRGHLRVGDRIAYGYHPERGSRILRHVFSVTGAAYRRIDGGAWESVEVGPQWEIVGRRGYTLALGGTLSRELLEQPFLITDDVAVPVGDHRFHTFSLSARSPTGGKRRVTAGAQAGTFYDGHRYSFQLSPSWDVSPRLELLGDYELERIKMPGEGQEFTAHLARFQPRVYLSPSLSASTLVQYNSLAGVAGWHVRVRYNPREGDDLYLVWTENRNTDRFRMNPHPPALLDRTLMIKFARTF